MIYLDHTRTEKGIHMDFEKGTILHISNTVKVLEKKNIKKILHNQIGIIISMVGDIFPFMYGVKIGEKEYCFKGDEIEIIP
jgi:hypothetical protein